MAEDKAIALLREATAAHKKGQLAEAEVKYREALALTKNESPKVLLASVLLSVAHTKANVLAARSESLQLAREAINSARLLQPSTKQSTSGSGIGTPCASASSASTLTPAQQALLRTRYGYFLLQFAGYVRVEGRRMEEPVDLSPGQRREMLSEAIAHLELAAETATKPDALVWRNLSLAYTACERLEDSERACAMCVVCAGGVARGSATTLKRTAVQDSGAGAGQGAQSMAEDRAPWDLHYKHAKALKRVGKEIEALEKYCDAVEASARQGTRSDGTRALAAGAGTEHEMPLFWLRVAEAGGVKGEIPAPLRARVRELLALYQGRTRSSKEGGEDEEEDASETAQSKGGSAAAEARATAVVPHEYIRKLFDGYSKHFDEHLVQGLRYETPTKLLQLLVRTLQALTGQSGAVKASDGADPAPSRPSAALVSRVQSLLQDGSGSPVWARCADLGCGTGLAGVAFRPLVRYLAGSDLSPGMIAEAEKRVCSSRRAPLYDLLQAAEIASWTEDQVQAWETSAAATATATAASGPCFDLVLAADVLVYIGDLAPVFSACAKAMRGAEPSAASGEGEGEREREDRTGSGVSVPRYMIFSTESLEALLGKDHPAAAADGQGYVLTGTGRCVHARSYVHRLARRFGFVPVCVQGEVIRQNAGKDVLGDLYILEYKCM